MSKGIGPREDLVRRNLVISALLILCCSHFATRIKSQESTPEWQADVNRMLSEFLACKTPIDDRSPCNVFLGRALKRVYGIADFGLPGTPDSFLSANAIADKVATDSNWTFLGTADVQQKLDQAQGYANLNKAVIAVYKSSGHGHVCLIYPGKMQLSSTWNTLVPNSASFPLDDPTHAYVGGPLSKAFGVDKRGDVKFYGRNF